MDEARLRALRLRHHRLTAPARTVVDAARHMLCVQSQDFWGGRLALAARTRSATTSAVDAAYDRGELVRSWPQRGTLHTIPARDLRWVLSVTAERMLAQLAPRDRELGITDATVAQATTVLTDALSGGNALTRTGALERWASAGIAVDKQRGSHLIARLALRAVICWGPVVRRAGVEPGEQRIVLVDEWIAEHRAPDDPLAEMFVRYIEGHGPATPEDFAWWAGVTRRTAWEAAERATGMTSGSVRDAGSHGAVDDAARRAGEPGTAEEIETRLTTIEHNAQTLFLSANPPRRSASAVATHALPSFEEYYISYADRSPVSSESARAAIGPGANGMVRPVIVHEGEVIGVWRPPPLRQRATGDAGHRLFAAPGVGGETPPVGAALDRAMVALRG